MTCRSETAPATDVLSEGTKPRPDEPVLKWLHGLDEARTLIGIVSIAEIRRGVALMDAGRKRDAPDEWLRYDLPHFQKQDYSGGRACRIDLGRPHGACRAKRSWARLDGRADCSH